jgi:hypothetical protein
MENPQPTFITAGIYIMGAVQSDIDFHSKKNGCKNQEQVILVSKES